MSDLIHFDLRGDVALITVDNPPVNALSQPVRAGLLAAFEQLASSTAKAAVLICKGRTFIAGADISEFGKPPADPWLPEVLADIESSAVPVIAAMHGTALGGGLETAMACHFRMAVPAAKLGLPEVMLGLLPGAGGTQWAPRLMGVERALDLMTSGKPIGAETAQESGLLDRITEGDLESGALAWAREMIDSGTAPRRTSELAVESSHLPDGFFDEARAAVAKRTRGLPAPQSIVDCMEAAVALPADEAAAFERDRFMELMMSPESEGLRHLFFAERQASRVEGIPRETVVRDVASIGIIGAGTMGGGIAMCFANAGIPVTLLEISEEALQRGLAVCHGNYERSAKKGRMSEEQVEQRMGLIRGTTSYLDLSGVDLVIEAVFENPDIKKKVFRKLDEVCKPGAILASNTSYQDIDDIAAVTSRPQDVLGLHFFSPANIMKLLEVVRGGRTAPDVLATVMQLARRIRKVPVLARVCYGFIGNRMFEQYMRAALNLLLEGARPAQVDKAMEEFGMAMGPLAVLDLSGLDIGYKARQALQNPPQEPAYALVDRLVERGRLGQKSGAGFYRYDAQTRQRLDDPEVETMIREESTRLGTAPRSHSTEEIVNRLLVPLVLEGRRILDEGVAQRPGDIDVVFAYGYGFPAHRGGPMFHSDKMGPVSE